MSLFVHYLSLPYLIEGIWFTVVVTALGLAGGLILGLVLAAMQLSRFLDAGCIRPGLHRDLSRHAADPADGVRLRRVAADRPEAQRDRRCRSGAGRQRSALHRRNASRRRARRRPRTGPGRPGARDDAGPADAAHHRAAGHSHDDSRLRQRNRQRPEEFLARERDLGAGADAAKHAACVLDLRLLLDLLCLRPDLSGAHHRGQPDPAVRGAGARSRPRHAAGSPRRLPALVSRRSADD